jgi:hypothetical protein
MWAQRQAAHTQRQASNAAPDRTLIDESFDGELP